jgi:hypothetical protein
MSTQYQMNSFSAELRAREGVLLGAATAIISPRFVSAEMAEEWLTVVVRCNKAAGRFPGASKITEWQDPPEIPLRNPRELEGWFIRNS